MILPGTPEKLSAFCQFSGLKHYLERGPRPNPEHPQCETVPLLQFYQSVHTQARRVSSLVRRHNPNLSDDSDFYLGAALSEVMQNIEDHAESTIGGVMCARYMSASHQVRAAVVDHGIGIGDSMRRKYADLDDAAAIAMALRGGYTSQSKAQNQGLGLKNLSDIVRNLHGEMYLFSGSAWAVQAEGGDRVVTEGLRIEFPGTAVFFNLVLGTA